MAMHIGKDLVAASATPLVLGILAEEESYGYAILKRVEESSGGEIAWTEGMLYPLLHRLERQGQIESTWRDSEAGRRRKHYRITAAGRTALADQLRQWSVITGAFAQIWGKAQAGVALTPDARPGRSAQAVGPDAPINRTRTWISGLPARSSNLGMGQA